MVLITLMTHNNNRIVLSRLKCCWLSSYNIHIYTGTLYELLYDNHDGPHSLDRSVGDVIKEYKKRKRPSLM